MKIYLLRHGQTDYNFKGCIQGDLNIPLNKSGRQQALDIKTKIDNLDIDLIITSPIARALETANIINQGRNLDVITDGRLVERNFGEIIGKPFIDFKDKLCLDIENDFTDFKVESVESLLKRTNEFLEFIKNKYYDRNILVVSHEAPLKAIIMNIDGYDKKSIKISNCELFKYEIG